MRIPKRCCIMLYIAPLFLKVQSCMRPSIENLWISQSWSGWNGSRTNAAIDALQGYFAGWPSEGSRHFVDNSACKTSSGTKAGCNCSPKDTSLNGLSLWNFLDSPDSAFLGESSIQCGMPALFKFDPNRFALCIVAQVLNLYHKDCLYYYVPLGTLRLG